MSGYAFRRPDGKPVGQMVDGYLLKHVDTALHQLTTPPAWAIDCGHLAELWLRGGKGIRLIDETGAVWTAGPTTFERWGLDLK